MTANPREGVSDDVIAKTRRLEGSGLRTFRKNHPLVWERTEGAIVWDCEGRRYIDLDAASAVATIGHCHPRVTEAIRRQAGVMTHCPSGTPSRVRVELYERLLSIAPSGLTRVMPAISGALANETAVQLARRITGRTKVVSFSGAYAGRSVGALPLAGKRAYREFLGVPGDSQFLPFPDMFRSPWARGGDPCELVLGLLETMVDDPASGLDAPACVIVEPVQGNGGVVFAPDGFLRGLRQICDRVGALLIFDEIQCGFGRTGYVWASEREGVVPDLMTVGKGIGGGLSTAAIYGSEEHFATWEPDTVTATFLLNALNAVAATSAVDVFHDERLWERSSRLGEVVMDRLKSELGDRPDVGDVRGRGLFVGIDIVSNRLLKTPDPIRAAKIVRLINETGVLVGLSGRFGNVIKVCPPLVIDEGDLDAGLTAIVKAV